MLHKKLIWDVAMVVADSLRCESQTVHQSASAVTVISPDTPLYTVERKPFD